MTLVQLAATAAGTLVSRTGAPVAGATLNVYETETETPIDVWVDRGGSVALTQPLQTDSSGQAPGWASDGQTVDFHYSFDGQTADPLTAELVSASDETSQLPSSVVNATGAPAGYVPIASGSNGFAWGPQTGGSSSSIDGGNATSTYTATIDGGAAS